MHAEDIYFEQFRKWAFSFPPPWIYPHVPMRNLIQCMGDMALMPKICEKSHIFDDFWDLWSPNMTTYPTPGAL